MTDTQPFLLYTAPSGAVKVQVFFKAESVWLTQKSPADLFGVKVPAINKHLKNIYESGELVAQATISKLETVQSEGRRQIARELDDYNLDAIIAVGSLILQDKGKVSALEAKLKAEGEYEVFRQRQDADYLFDFDREIKRIEGKKI